MLIIGAGPRIIGQSAECDEGALEAARTLTDHHCRIITVNSNPDAIITAPPWAYRSYLEPLTTFSLNQIIAAEKPDAVLPTFGGRQALHLAADLAHSGVLGNDKTALWGSSADSVEQVLNRDTLNSALSQIGLATPSIFRLSSMETAIEKAQELGFPVVLRRADTDLMPDGALIYNQDELRHHALPGFTEGLQAISIEASLIDWQQAELEILRDSGGQSVVVGAVEYIDTAGIHPGDAIAVSPPQSFSADRSRQLATLAQRIADHLNIIGNATIRFALSQADGAVLILAVHPRYTRTSALVARIFDIPLAALAALLAAGYTWQTLPAVFSMPSAWPLDAAPSAHTPVAVKWPCWDFGRLKSTADRLGLQMQAVGQSVGYGLGFKEALQKAARAAAGNDIGLGAEPALETSDLETLRADLSSPSSRRLMMILEAMRRGVSIEELGVRTHIAPWFLGQLRELADLEAHLRSLRGKQPAGEVLLEAKAAGFSHRQLCALLELSDDELNLLLGKNRIKPAWRPLSTPAGSLRFSSYHDQNSLQPFDGQQKILIIGSGAYRIGQGPECDFGIHQAVETLEAMGHRPIILNCNLASITTGRALNAGCYCDPIDDEAILGIIAQERPTGVITQYAGLAADRLTSLLARAGLNILGADAGCLQLINDRGAFKKRMRELGMPQPAGAVAASPEQLVQICADIGYPVQIKQVNQGSADGVHLLQDNTMLQSFLETADSADCFPLLVEQFLEYAIEVQAETLCDGSTAQVAAVLEHIELAGVHAGDSACVLPPYSIGPRHIETITAYCQKIGVALGARGLLNLRFAIYRDTVYLLEAAYNTCRNLAVVSRVFQLPLAAMATRLVLGADLADLQLTRDHQSHFGVRAAVFPFNVFESEDPLLGPRMRSVGQVVSIADSFGSAYFKSQEAAGSPLPTQGTVLITVTDEDKASILEPARIFQELGFQIMATRGTHNALAANGIQSQLVRKLGYGRPNLLDEMKNGHVQLVINTPTGGQGQIDDSIIRKTAIGYHIANMTTPASALAAAKGIAAQRQGRYTPRVLQGRRES